MMVDGDPIPAGEIEPGPQPSWHVLWTHSHCERLLSDQLRGMGYTVFVPELSVWSRRGGARRTLRQPMFPPCIASGASE